MKEIEDDVMKIKGKYNLERVRGGRRRRDEDRLKERNNKLEIASC